MGKDHRDARRSLSGRGTAVAERGQARAGRQILVGGPRTAEGFPSGAGGALALAAMPIQWLITERLALRKRRQYHSEVSPTRPLGDWPNASPECVGARQLSSGVE